MDKYEIDVKTEELVRLDHLLSDHFSDLSRTYLKSLIDDGLVLVNEKTRKASYKLKEGDKIIVKFPQIKKTEIKGQDIPLDVLYEDDYLLIVNKPQGMIVHPATGNYENTLVNALLYYTKNLSQVNGEMRPGIVHRIDKDTSGLLAVAKSNEAHISLAEQLKDRSILRVYIALVEGVVSEDTGKIHAPIGRHEKNRKKMAVVEKNSKDAITNFKVLTRYEQHTLLECRLLTGRTHQIRVHLNFIGHPIVGDAVYGLRKQNLYYKGQLLHAYKLGFKHPISEEYMEFTADLPRHFQKVLNKL